MHGAPAAELDQVAAASAFASGFSAAVQITMTLKDGGRLTAGSRELLVYLRPGHSPTDTILVDADGWALVADHLPARGRTVVVARRPTADARPANRTSGVINYLESLSRTAALGLRRAFPGHGATVADPAAAITRQIEFQDERASLLRAALGTEPHTAWELVELLHGGGPHHDKEHLLSMGQILLGDALGHLDLLVAAGQVLSIPGATVRFVTR